MVKVLKIGGSGKSRDVRAASDYLEKGTCFHLVSYFNIV